MIRRALSYLLTEHEDLLIGLFWLAVFWAILAGGLDSCGGRHAVDIWG